MSRLDEYLSFLEKARRYTWEEYEGDPKHYGSAERFLHLSLEALMDRAGHVIAEMNLGFVNRYRDMPQILADHAWLDEELKEK